VIDYVNAQEKPLALYVFTTDAAVRDACLQVGRWATG
jgi:hypothetical protein